MTKIVRFASEYNIAQVVWRHKRLTRCSNNVANRTIFRPSMSQKQEPTRSNAEAAADALGHIKEMRPNVATAVVVGAVIIAFLVAIVVLLTADISDAIKAIGTAAIILCLPILMKLVDLSRGTETDHEGRVDEE